MSVTVAPEQGMRPQPVMQPPLCHVALRLANLQSRPKAACIQIIGPGHKRLHTENRKWSDPHLRVAGEKVPETKEESREANLIAGPEVTPELGFRA